jgi:hypothetical protein
LLSIVRKSIQNPPEQEGHDLLDRSDAKSEVGVGVAGEQPELHGPIEQLRGPLDLLKRPLGHLHISASQLIENQLSLLNGEFWEWLNLAEFPDVEEQLQPSEVAVFLKAPGLHTTLISGDQAGSERLADRILLWSYSDTDAYTLESCDWYSADSLT